jgi:hypothetical protein
MIPNNLPIFNLIKQQFTKLYTYIFIVAFVIGAYTRFGTITSYTGFQADQARDAFVYMEMKKSNLPTLGPSSSIGGYSLPPFYYFYVFPITIFGNDPIIQIIPNSIASFLTIFVFGILIYTNLDNLKRRKKILLASLGSLWWSIATFGVSFDTVEWNPVPIPLFSMLFLLLAQKIINSPHLKHPYVIWAMLGLTVSILASLHTITLLFIPLTFLVLCLYYQIRYRRWQTFGHIALSTSIIAITNFTYIQSELINNFQSLYTVFMSRIPYIPTLQILLALALVGLMVTSFLIFNKRAKIVSKIIALVTNGKINPVVFILFCIFAFLFTNELSRRLLDISIYAHIKNIFHLYTHNIWNNTLFLEDKYALIPTFLALVYTLYALIKTKFRNFTINFYILSCIALLAIADITDIQLHRHYTILVWSLPIFLIILSFRWKSNYNLIVYLSIILYILSIFQNIKFDILYVQRKYNTQRPINSKDMEEITKLIPQDSSVCMDRQILYKKSFEYIDSYVTKTNHKYLTSCESANYFVHTKYILGPYFSVLNYNSEIKSQLQMHEHKDGDSYTIYKIVSAT